MLPAVLSAHALLIAAIFVPYFLLMAVLGCYMAGQVRHHDEEPEQLPELTPRDDEPGELLAAA